MESCDIELRSYKDYVTKKLNKGKNLALTSRDLHELYIKDGGTYPYHIFFRHLRREFEHARRIGIHICGDIKGYYIALNEKEWIEYNNLRLQHIKSIIETFSKVNGIKTNETIKMIFPKKKDDPDQQYTLFL